MQRERNPGSVPRAHPLSIFLPVECEPVEPVLLFPGYPGGKGTRLLYRKLPQKDAQHPFRFGRQVFRALDSAPDQYDELPLPLDRLVLQPVTQLIQGAKKDGLIQLGQFPWL